MCGNISFPERIETYNYLLNHNDADIVLNYYSTLDEMAFNE